MSDQKRLRAKLAAKEAIHARRLAMIAERHAREAQIVEQAEREIMNLRAQLTISSVPMSSYA